MTVFPAPAVTLPFCYSPFSCECDFSDCIECDLRLKKKNLCAKK